MKTTDHRDSGKAAAGFVRYSVISILVLIGAFPLAAGIIFRSSSLRWAGVLLVGLAALLALLQLIAIGWFWLRSPKPRPAPTRLTKHEHTG